MKGKKAQDRGGIIRVRAHVRQAPHLIMPAPKGVTQCKNQQFFSIFFFVIHDEYQHQGIGENKMLCASMSILFSYAPWVLSIYKHVCPHTKNLCEDNPNFTPSCVQV